MKLNERTKQMKRNRFLKTNWGKKSALNNSCYKWNNLNIKLRKVKAKQNFKFDLKTF